MGVSTLNYNVIPIIDNNYIFKIFLEHYTLHAFKCISKKTSLCCSFWYGHISIKLQRAFHNHCNNFIFKHFVRALAYMPSNFNNKKSLITSLVTYVFAGHAGMGMYTLNYMILVSIIVIMIFTRSLWQHHTPLYFKERNNHHHLAWLIQLST